MQVAVVLTKALTGPCKRKSLKVWRRVEEAPITCLVPFWGRSLTSSRFAKESLVADTREKEGVPVAKRLPVKKNDCLLSAETIRSRTGTARLLIRETIPSWKVEPTLASQPSPLGALAQDSEGSAEFAPSAHLSNCVRPCRGQLVK